jgi:large subunit ribosomal protein L29
MATMSLAAASPLTSTPRGLAVSAPRTSFLGLRALGASAARFPGLAAAPRRGEAAVVRMAKREQELEEIRAMETEKLEEEVVDLKGELFLLRLKRSARQEFKSSEFGRMRKRVCIPLAPSVIIVLSISQLRATLLSRFRSGTLILGHGCSVAILGVWTLE